MRKDIIELYEPFYQYTKQPSDSQEWRELRALVDKLIEKIDRPKGKWIDNPPDSWICSNCGTHYEERLTFKAHNYCCVCGADMRGEE